MTFIRRHSLLTYFALAFAISWVGVLLVIGGPGGIPATPEEFRRLFPAGYLAMLAGPSIAGVLCTGLVHGAAGFREYRSRLLRWRVGVRWYVVALLTAPLVVTVSVWVLSAIVSRFAPGATIAGGRTPPPLVFGILVGSGAGILEELGWTGFA
ncbi:MAG: hypothetical protein ACREL3_01170, partial [Gemmatimonadales bacterium]